VRWDHPNGSSYYSNAEPNGYTVTLTTAGATDIDFFNVRTITVTCTSQPQTFTVGDGTIDPIATVKFGASPDCKPGEYVFETWVAGDEQFVSFYPAFDTSSLPKVPLIEDITWVINGDWTQQTLYYDDFVAGVPERPMLFCEVDENGDFVDFPDPVAPDTYLHTSCLLGTDEDPTETGVLRIDTIYTKVDGNYRIK
jgi:hypothetical protein